MKAPPMHNSCIREILPVHFSPTVIRISSRVTVDKPNMAGKAMKATNRSISGKPVILVPGRRVPLLI